MKNNMKRYAEYLMMIDLLMNFNAKDFTAIRYSNKSIKIISKMPNKRSPLFFSNGNNIPLSVWLKSARFLIIRKESLSVCGPRKNAVEHTNKKVAVIFSPFNNRGALIKPLIRFKYNMKGLKILANTI